MVNHSNVTSMNPNDTCGACCYFVKFGEEPRGACHFNPPIPLASGGVVRAQVRVKEIACGQFKALSPGQPPAEKIKTQPDTPGAAAKFARKNVK